MKNISSVKFNIDDVIFSLMLLEIMIFRWLSVLNYGALAIELLIILRLIMGKNSLNKIGSCLCVCILLFLYLFFNYLIIGGSLSNFIYNLRDVVSFPILILYFLYLIKIKPQYLENKQKYIFVALNWYYVANIIAIILELNGYTWVCGFSRGTNAVHLTAGAWDSISGLLGVNGHHLLAIYTSLMAVLNINKIQKMKRGINRSLWIIYTVFIVAFMTWISVEADNKAFYITILIFLINYYATAKNNISIDRFSILKKIQKNFKGICAILIVLAVLYAVFSNIPQFAEQFYFMQRTIVRATEESGNTEGSGERIAMIIYAFDSITHQLFGRGVAIALWKQPNYLGFVHFGQSDLAAFLVLGGIVFVFLIFLCLDRLLHAAYKNNFLRILMHLLFLYLMSYTLIITDMSGLLIFLLYFMLCYTRYRNCD